MRTRTQNLTDDVAEGIVWTVVGAWILLVMLVALTIGAILYTTGYYTMLPTWMRLERQAIVQSNQYIVTQRDHLTKLADQFDQLDSEIAYLAKDPTNDDVIDAKRRQQTGIVRDMKATVANLPPTEVPARILGYLGR